MISLHQKFNGLPNIHYSRAINIVFFVSVTNDACIASSAQVYRFQTITHDISHNFPYGKAIIVQCHCCEKLYQGIYERKVRTLILRENNSQWSDCELENHLTAHYVS